MAATRQPRSVIDTLPEHQRQKVIDALMGGVTMREVAEMVGISLTSVMAYKKRVIKPALQTAQKFQSLQAVTMTGTEKVKQQQKLVRQVVESSPFRDRLERLWHRADSALDKAETAVREVKDSQGNTVVIAQDLNAIAPLLNQAHKNLAMLGQATGELVEQGVGNVSIQVVLPAAGSSASINLSQPIEMTQHGDQFEIDMPKR